MITFSTLLPPRSIVLILLRAPTSLANIPVYSTTPHPLTVDSGQDSSQAAVLLLALKVKLLAPHVPHTLSLICKAATPRKSEKQSLSYPAPTPKTPPAEAGA
jgi:hypothetical protein